MAVAVCGAHNLNLVWHCDHCKNKNVSRKARKGRKDRRRSLLGPGFSDQIESLFYWPGQYCPVVDLDDRPLKEIWMFDHSRDDLAVRSFRRQPKFLKLGLPLPQNIERSKAGLFDQAAQFRLCQRLNEVIYLVVINAVFPKQRCQIAARRSGRLFVDGYLFSHIVRQKRECERACPEDIIGTLPHRRVSARSASARCVSIRFCVSS